MLLVLAAAAGLLLPAPPRAGVAPRRGVDQLHNGIVKLNGADDYAALLESTHTGECVACVWFSGHHCKACKALAPRYERRAVHA